jgi:hypothetical protein
LLIESEHSSHKRCDVLARNYGIMIASSPSWHASSTTTGCVLLWAFKTMWYRCSPGRATIDYPTAGFLQKHTGNLPQIIIIRADFPRQQFCHAITTYFLIFCSLLSQTTSLTISETNQNMLLQPLLKPTITFQQILFI